MISHTIRKFRTAKVGKWNEKRQLAGNIFKISPFLGEFDTGIGNKGSAGMNQAPETNVSGRVPGLAAGRRYWLITNQYATPYFKKIGYHLPHRSGGKIF